MKKRLLAVLLTVAMTITFLMGCGGKETTSSGDSDEGVKEVKVGISEDPSNLGPWAPLSKGRFQVLISVYQTLVQRDGFGGEMTGVLMKDYEQVDDVTYNCTIYDYIKDTDGNPMTATDVAFSFQQGMESGNYPKLNSIVSVEAIDDYTAQFVFNHELAAGELVDIWTECYVVTQAAYEASGDQMATEPVGTTAYKVTDYVTGSSLTIEKTNDYWQTDDSLTLDMYKANIDKATFEFITDESQMAIALQTGAIDMTNAVSATDVALFEEGGESADDFTVFKVPGNSVTCISFNCDESSVTSNENLRKAIMYGFDSQGIVDTVYKGDAITVNGLGSSKYSDYNPEWDEEDYFGYNEDTAKDYLAKFESESGKNAEDLSVRILCEAGTGNLESVAQVLQGYLSKMGINATIEAIDSSTFDTYWFDSSAWDICLKQHASTDYLINWWKDYLDADNYTWGGTVNFIYDEELQNLMDLCQTVDGHTQENMDAAQAYINEHAYYCGILEEYERLVAANFVTDVKTDCRNFILPGACSYK